MIAIVATRYSHQRALVRRLLEEQGYDVLCQEDETELLVTGGSEGVDELRRALYSIMPTVGTHELWLDGVRLVQ